MCFWNERLRVTSVGGTIVKTNFRVWIALLVTLGPCLGCAAAAERTYGVRLTVTSDLPMANVPMDPTIDFESLIKEARLPGVLDPNSIEVVNLETGDPVPCALHEDFAYGDKGRVEWVIGNPKHMRYEIRFSTAPKRPPLNPAEYTPRIGTGDLLRYNAGKPRPIALPCLSGLVDLTGDGKRDLVGCWNYSYRPGSPWSGVICYPRVRGADGFEFGDLARVRHRFETEEDRKVRALTEHHGIPCGKQSGEFDHFISRSVYMQADFADLNGDGLTDIASRPWYHKKFLFYLNTGKRDNGGMPVFAGAVAVPAGNTSDYYGEFRVVDLDNDGALDIVVRSSFCRNTNPKGWPIRLAEPVVLDAGYSPCFYDVDGDGRLDAVGLSTVPGSVRVQGDPGVYRLAWRKNLGQKPPKFGPPEILEDIDAFYCSGVAAVNDGPRRGLLVQHDVGQAVSLYEQVPSANGKPCFKRFGRAESLSAVMSLSDQSTPFVCDWDADGDLDLLVGGGYGWPRIVINEGTTERPVYTEARLILSDGKPIRLIRNNILGKPYHGHNMGYIYPAFADWDLDGLPDLILANETNRIFWYKNIGSRTEPKFGPRLQILVDGYPDSPELRAQSARRASDPKSPRGCYPPEKEQPFPWRTRANPVDLNGDGLTDLIANDGWTDELTLFARHRDAGGKLRLKKDRALKLADGRPIDAKVVPPGAKMLVDWDGDGLLDVIASAGGWHYEGSIYLLRNCGTRTAPKFEKPVNMCCFGEPIHITRHSPHPWAGDFDGDGRPDLLCYVEWSVYPFYSHAALTMKKRPTFRLGKMRTY